MLDLQIDKAEQEGFSSIPFAGTEDLTLFQSELEIAAISRRHWYDLLQVPKVSGVNKGSVYSLPTQYMQVDEEDITALRLRQERTLNERQKRSLCNMYAAVFNSLGQKLKKNFISFEKTKTRHGPSAVYIHKQDVINTLKA